MKKNFKDQSVGRRIKLKVKDVITGFTLIELLVVISIIGMLTAFAIPNFIGARERARDTRRKSDIKQIQKALELYKQDRSSPAYPTAVDPNYFLNDATFCTTPQPWQESENIYMNEFPCDPLATPYYYQSPRTGTNDDNLTYQLYACLENKSDTGGIVADPAICPSALKYEETEP